ncbi:MAG: YlbF family regulator [Lachnospirales bacterium]
MDNLVNMAKEISNQFINSDLYKEYKRLYDIIDKDEVLKGKINSYKIRQIEYQTSLVEGGNPRLDEEAEISRAYTELKMNKTARNFLKNEKELLVTLNEIYEALGDDIDIAVVFDEENLK